METITIRQRINFKKVDFGVLTDSEVTSSMRSKVKKMRRMYDEHPERFIDIR